MPVSRFIDLHFAADSMSLGLLLFTQLSLKFEGSESELLKYWRETEFDMK